MCQQLLDAILEHYINASVVRFEQDANAVNLFEFANELQDVVKVEPILHESPRVSPTPGVSITLTVCPENLNVKHLHICVADSPST